MKAENINLVDGVASKVVVSEETKVSSNQSTFAESSRRWAKLKNNMIQETAVDDKIELVETEILETTVLDVVSEVQSRALVAQQHRENEVIKHARANELTKRFTDDLGYEVAEPIVNRLFDDGLLDSSVKVTTLDGEHEHIFRLIVKGNGSTEVLDVIEPENGTGTITENNTFDALYMQKTEQIGHP